MRVGRARILQCRTYMYYYTTNNKIHGYTHTHTRTRLGVTPIIDCRSGLLRVLLGLNFLNPWWACTDVRW